MLLKPQLRLSSLQALAKASATVCARLYEFVTDRSGSHVARRLLCVLAGRNVLPATTAGRAKDGASYAKATKVDRGTPELLVWHERWEFACHGGIEQHLVVTSKAGQLATQRGCLSDFSRTDTSCFNISLADRCLVTIQAPTPSE